MIWRFDVDFGIDFGVVNLNIVVTVPFSNSPSFSIFPCVLWSGNPFCATWGRLWGWWLTLSVDSSGTNMLVFYSSIFHVIALPWLWTQRVPVNFFPAASWGFGYNSILGWLCIYDSPPINIWYLDLATIYSGQIIKGKIWRRVSYEPWMHRSTRPWSGRTICL